MKKIKILEVTQVDLIGKRYNGYDMIEELDTSKFDIKQAVILKQSDNKNVINLLKNNGQNELMQKYIALENNLSIKNVLSITAPLLMNSKEYKEADIIHFHQFHNANLSLPYIRKIASEKKVIMTLHDPWMLTGHCVHFYDCEKWKSGCKSCPNLTSYFPVAEDHCHDMWCLKENIMDNVDIDVVVSSDWMYDLVRQSPIFKKQKNIHKIPFGIDENKFRSTTKKEARKYYSISEDAFVFFVRAQSEFKGSGYLLDALKQLELKDKEVILLTCENEHLFDEVKDKITIMDLGLIKDQEMIYAMNACDVFLMPSIGESFGLMAIEAMSCSKPVIVFNNTALPSVTHAPEISYLVKNRDSKDLMKTIKYTIEHPEDVKRRGKKAYELVQKEYTNKSYVEKLNKLYLDVNKRNHRKKEWKLKVEEDENTNQFKFLLNDFTVRSFGTKSNISKKLMYDTKNKKRIPNYTFSFSEENMQNLIIDYTTKLEEIYCKEKMKTLENNKKIKLEKILYFMKNNPRDIWKAITKRIQK